MQTDKWGSHEWESMSYKVFASPLKFTPEDKERYKLFFHSNIAVLPCGLCCNSFTTISSYFPIDSFLDGRYSLCYWLFILHNLVNRKLQKPLYAFTDYIYKYEINRARCGNKNDVVKFSECMKTLKPFTMEDAAKIATECSEQYKPIITEYLKKYYSSNDVLDPEFIKRTRKSV